MGYTVRVDEWRYTCWFKFNNNNITVETGTRREPFNSTPMAVNSIPSGSPQVRPMGVHRTCGEPDEIKKNTHPKDIIALFRAGSVLGTELYDHRGDPGELDWHGEHVNVVHQAANAPVVQALHKKILGYIQLK